MFDRSAFGSRRDLDLQPKLNGPPDERNPAIVGSYGTLVETWAVDRYPIERDDPEVDGFRFDATDETDSRPWAVNTQ